MTKQIIKAAEALSKHRAVDKTLAGALVVALSSEMESSGGTRLALQIGVTPQYLSDVKNGRRAVSNPLVAKILLAK